MTLKRGSMKKHPQTTKGPKPPTIGKASTGKGTSNEPKN
jgi:hypothetical protein